MKKVRPLGFWLGIGLLCLVASILGGAFSHNFGTSSYTISYADFVSVLLTAISLIMALLAFFIAILAYIGWNSINGKVASEVQTILAEGFREGQPLHQMFLDQKDRAMFDGVMEIDTEFDEDADAEALEDR